MNKSRRLLLQSYLSAALLALVGCANQATTEHAHHEEGDKKMAMSMAKPPVACVGTPIECAQTISSAFDNHGRLWVAYVNDKYLYLQSSTDKGHTFTPAVKVNQVQEGIAARDESRPKIKFDAENNLYLTWTSDIPNAKERHNGNVRFSRSIDGGKTFAEPVTVNDENPEVAGHRFDSLAIGKKGEIFIAWLDARDKVAAKKSNSEYLGSSLYYVWSNDGGKHFYPNKLAAAHTCECCRLQTEIDTDNKPVVVWRHVFEGGIRDHALVKFNDWNTPGEITRISYENWKIDACPHHGTGFSIANDGTYHAVWFSNSAAQQGLFYGYSSNQGKRFSKPVNFAKQGAGHPHVLAIGKQVFIVWQHFDGKETSVQLLKSKDGGKTWSEARAIAKTDKKADQPFLISDGKAAYLSWKVQPQEFHLQAIQ